MEGIMNEKEEFEDEIEKTSEEIVELIKKDPRMKEIAEEYFYEELEICGELMIGDVSFDDVLEKIKIQGYWSGVMYNIFLCEEGFYGEKRVFGNRNS
jgi:hypothetical protein